MACVAYKCNNRLSRKSENISFHSKLANYIEGRYLVLDEQQFVENLKEDIDYFVQKSESKSVLVFPPLLSKYRYLAHKTIDEYFFPQLCSFSIGQESQRQIVVGTTIDITRCCLPYRCVHKKLIGISKVLEKPVDCICPARLKLLSFSFPKEDFQMPSSTCDPSSKYGAKDRDNTFFKPSERRRNENRPVVRDRQKRPDKQIYVPRALRGTPKCIPVENKIETEFENKSIQENNQTISDKHALCSESDKKSNFEAVNSESKIEKERLAHSEEEMVTGCTNFESEVAVSNVSSSLLSGMFRDKRQMASSSHSFEINILHNQKSQKITVFPQNVVNSDHSSSINDDSSLSFQDSEIQNTDNSCISDNIHENSDESLLENSSSEYSFQDSKTQNVDNSCISDNIHENSDESLLENSSSEYSFQNSKTQNTDNSCISDNIHENSDESLLENSSREYSFQDSITQNSDNSCISDNIHENSKESLLENSSREYKNKTIPKDKSGEFPYLENEDSWETKFDDDGECLNPEFVKELKNVTGQIKVLVAKQNYKDFQPTTDNANEGYDTIVELYDFPREFSTQDLVSAFSQFQQSSYSIKWVDDCHALAIFSSPAIANQALILNHPFVKVRPIGEGIKESKEKARWCARYCEPVKPRPTTSAVLARRLVSGALGLKVRATKEQRDQERSILNDAKEKRRLKAKQKQAIWDGKVL